MPNSFHISSRIRAWRRVWLALAWLIVTLLTATIVHAKGQEPEPVRPPQSLQVVQSLFFDSTQRLGFSEVREQTFKPFNGLERLSFGGKVGWLRLHIERGGADTGPLFLQLLPLVFDEVDLFTPSTREAGGWVSRSLTGQQMIGKVALGELAQAADVYLRLASRNDVSLLVFVGDRDDLQWHERKLDALVAVVTTLTVLGFLGLLWRTVWHFSWMSASIGVLLAVILLRTWIALGYANLLLGLSTAAGAALIAPLIIAVIAAAGCILILLTTELFAGQRWLRWLWVWPFVQACFLAYATWDPGAALRLSDLLWPVGPLILAASLIWAALREPETLQAVACKMAFAALLFICAVILFFSLQAHGQGLAQEFPKASDAFAVTLLLRGTQPLAMLAIALWIFERLRQERVQKMAEALRTSQESLSLESKRLERQRKFTAMLAHELKNPLTVSHMALSGIEARLGTDAPLLERASTIKQSLQEIDAIVERCSEMDGFEQGQLPMSIAPFTLGHLMTLLQAANPNERIYTLLRGISDEAVLVSDIQYLKIISSNLLTNALKYSPADTLVELAFRAVSQEGGGRTLELCVSNEVGVSGIPSAELAFERFYRAEAARNQSGAGIGLWLSQALAHALGSEVVMRNEGQKISFSLALPYS